MISKQKEKSEKEKCLSLREKREKEFCGVKIQKSYQTFTSTHQEEQSTISLSLSLCVWTSLSHLHIHKHPASAAAVPSPKQSHLLSHSQQKCYRVNTLNRWKSIKNYLEGNNTATLKSLLLPMEVTVDWGRFLCAAAFCWKLMRGVWLLQTTGGDNCIIILWTFGPTAPSLSADWIILDCCTCFFYKNKLTDGGGWYWCCWTGLVRFPCAWNVVQQTYSDDVCQFLAKYTTVSWYGSSVWNTVLITVCLQPRVPVKCVILCFGCLLVVFEASFGKAFPE